MDTIQRKKNRIQKREQAAHGAFSLLLLTVFVLGVSLFAFLRTTPVAQTITTLNGCVNTRFSSVLRNLPEGALYPVQFDPGDLSFFVVLGK